MFLYLKEHLIASLCLSYRRIWQTGLVTLVNICWVHLLLQRAETLCIMKNTL